MSKLERKGITGNILSAFPYAKCIRSYMAYRKRNGKISGHSRQNFIIRDKLLEKKKTEGAYHNEAKFQRWEVKTPQTKNSLTGYHDILKSHDWGVNNHI